MRPTLATFFSCIFAYFCATTSYAQPTHFTTSDYWKHQKRELLFGIGISNFLSDLGGLNTIGQDYSPLDLEFVMTRPSFHVGYRRRFRSLWCTKSLIQYGMLKGDDALTQEFHRNYRNLRVHTHLLEFSQTLEFIIWSSEHFGKRYSISGLKGHRNKNNLLYAIGGISAFMYMPQFPGGPLLRPLGTEGQGLPGGPKPYGLMPPGSPIALGLGMPFGLGFKYGIDALWRLTVELTWTKTFTDYLDDVSGVYYDKVALYEAYGSMSVVMSDPSSQEFPGKTLPGEIRGDRKQNDSYIFLNLSLVRNITIKRSRKIKHTRGVFKGPKGKW